MAKLNSLEQLGQLADDFEDDVVEPYNPEYVSNKAYQIPDISAYEKRFIHKVSIVEKKLRRAKIRFTWDADLECFVVKRYINSEYPTLRYIRINMDENDYSFGTEDEDLIYDGHASVVIKEVVAWMTSKLIKK